MHLMGLERFLALERVAAGKTLAVLGDPRFDPAAWLLPKEPDLGFVEVPAGAFLLGSDKKDDPEAYPDEMPHRDSGSRAIR